MGYRKNENKYKKLLKMLSKKFSLWFREPFWILKNNLMTNYLDKNKKLGY
jgi:hypothetical protein